MHLGEASVTLLMQGDVGTLKSGFKIKCVKI